MRHRQLLHLGKVIFCKHFVPKSYRLQFSSQDIFHVLLLCLLSPGGALGPEKYWCVRLDPQTPYPLPFAIL